MTTTSYIEPHHITPATIRSLDYNRYLCSLFSPAHTQHALHVIISFYHEIASIRDQVSDPTLGMIRLKWWKDELNDCFNDDKAPSSLSLTSHKHILLAELSTLQQHNILTKESLPLLHNIISARENEFSTPTLPTLNALEEHCTQLSLPLFLLHWQLITKQTTPDKVTKEALEGIAKACCMVGLLQASHFYIQQGYHFFPADLMSQHSLKMDRLGSPAFLTASQRVVKAIHAQASVIMQKNITAWNHIERYERKKLSPVVLPAIIAKNHLQNIKKQDYDVLTQTRSTLPLAIFLRLWNSNRRKLL